MLLELRRAEWGCDAKRVDVTARIREIWQSAEKACVNPDHLRSRGDPPGRNDPCPGVDSKELKLIFEGGNEVIIKQGEPVPLPDYHYLLPFDELVAGESAKADHLVQMAMGRALQDLVSRRMLQSSVAAVSMVQHAVESVPQRAKFIFDSLMRCLKARKFAISAKDRERVLDVLRDRFLRQKLSLRMQAESTGVFKSQLLGSMREQFLSKIDDAVAMELKRVSAELDLAISQTQPTDNKWTLWRFLNQNIVTQVVGGLLLAGILCAVGYLWTWITKPSLPQSMPSITAHPPAPQSVPPKPQPNPASKNTAGSNI
jgi:hypothetical protein